MTKVAKPSTTGRLVTAARTANSSVSRSTVSGRVVSSTERVAAARARVSADKKRGATTEDWIVKLASNSNQA